MKKIINLIKEKKVIMFGETHNTKEIPQFLESFIINKLKDFDIIVALEIPKEYENKVEEFFENEEGKCGLATKHYYNLIKKLKSNNIKMIFVDNFASNQKDREENMAMKILNIDKDSEKIIVISGDFHASSLPININGEIVETTGSILKNILQNDFASVRLVLNNDKDIFNNNFDAVINCDNTCIPHPNMKK